MSSRLRCLPARATLAAACQVVERTWSYPRLRSTDVEISGGIRPIKKGRDTSPGPDGTDLLERSGRVESNGTVGEAAVKDAQKAREAMVKAREGSAKNRKRCGNADHPHQHSRTQRVLVLY